MTRALTLLFTLALACSLTACEAGSSGPKICDSGVYQECPCADGTTGVQQCKDTGAEWGNCSCDAVVDPVPDAGTTDTVDTPDVIGSGPDVIGSGPDVIGSGPDVPVVDPDTHEPPDVGEECKPQWEKVCNGDIVVWVDSCGTLGDTIESCAEIGYCSSGACVEACLPKHEERCSGDSIYWFDSCGVKESVSLQCAEDEFCIGCHEDDDLCSKEAQCAKAFYNGEWKVSADPNTKDACGMGNSTYFDLVIDLTIHEDGTAEAFGDVLDYDLHYVGQLTGKNLEMIGTYSQTSMGMTIDHEEVIDVDFTDLETFEGLSADTFVMPVLGGCTLYWNITGIKQ
jgi:hypothetical protein